jgi:hypothetical protein
MKSYYNPEYLICRQLAIYLRLQYPKALFHFDMAGLGLSKTQAGMMKAIQGTRGYPDLFIAEKRGIYSGLFIEIKADGVNIFKKNGTDFSTPHIEEQDAMLDILTDKGYAATFGIGFNQCKTILDAYLNYGKLQR